METVYASWLSGRWLAGDMVHITGNRAGKEKALRFLVRSYGQVPEGPPLISYSVASSVQDSG